MAPAPTPGRLALLVGGGPAPGLNGVISSVTIEAIESGIEVIGFQDGFKWLVKGDATHYRKLLIDDVKGIYPRGGSVLGTSRTNPAKSDEHMRNVLDALRKLNVTMLVTIGGDDTAFSGSQVYLRAGGAIRVAHVPKTIDNDLPLPGATPTFGYETARHLGVGIVRNLAEDARTTSRWYLIVSMGRAAGHLALGIGKAAAATLTIIPEEFRGRQVNIDEVCDILIGSIVKRRSANIQYGVAVLAEGLIEAIGDKGLQAIIDEGQLGRYGSISRDDHGHLRLGDIDFGRMMKDALDQEAQGDGPGSHDHRQGARLRAALRRPDSVRRRVHARPGLRGGPVPAVRRVGEVRGGHQPGGRPAAAGALRGHDQPGNASHEAAQGERGRRELPLCAGVHDPAGVARRNRAGAAGRLAEAANMTPEQFRQRFAAVATDA